MLVGRALSRWLFGASILALLFAAGCGYSEDEWRAKLREIENLKGQLAAEQEQNKVSQGELDEARARIEQLKAQLKAAGVDIANLSKDVEEKARALEEYKRRAAQLEAIRKRFEALRDKLQDLTRLGLNVTIRKNRMVIQLPGDVLFDSGRDSLKKKGKEILAKVAEVVRTDSTLNSRDFQVAGHTDSRPVGASMFRDNWGLSVMRARQVLVFLIGPVKKGGGGLDPNHWSAAGYGDIDPVATNDTREGRQSNRRCELVVLPNVEEMLDLKTLLK